MSNTSVDWSWLDKVSFKNPTFIEQVKYSAAEGCYKGHDL